MRPVLKPGLRRVWRAPGTVQLGLDPQRALVLTGVDPRVERLLTLLDGTRDQAAVLAEAAACGLDRSAGARLLDLLRDAAVVDDAAGDVTALGRLTRDERDRLAPDLASWGLLHPEPGGGPAVLARRRGARVRLVGAGRVGAAVAALLAAAGVGHLEVVDDRVADPGDLTPGGARRCEPAASRARLVRAALQELAPSTGTAPVGERPDLVVLTGEDPGMAEHRTACMRADVAHLYAAVRETTAVIGPLVLPGRSPCRRCLDLARADRDPQWPRVAAQLATPPRPPYVDACDTVLATLTAAVTALQALSHLDGEPTPPTVGGTLELALPDWRLRRRSWSAHPACGCAWAASA